MKNLTFSRKYFQSNNGGYKSFTYIRGHGCAGYDLIFSIDRCLPFVALCQPLFHAIVRCCLHLDEVSVHIASVRIHFSIMSK